MSPRAVAHRMDGLLTGHGYVKAAVHTAVLNLVGQRLGVPVSTLLGGALVDRLCAEITFVLEQPCNTVDVAVAASPGQSPAFEIFGPIPSATRGISRHVPKRH